jgi:hypothetical protein
MRSIALVLTAAVLVGCGAAERAAAPDPAAEKHAILAIATGHVPSSRPRDVCRHFTAAFRRELAKAADARSCEEAGIRGVDGHHIAVPSASVPLDVRVHGARAEVTLAPGRYYVRPVVVGMARERGRWLIDGETFPPLTRIGDCFMDVGSQYLDGDWKWRGVTDASVSEYIDRLCRLAVDQHVYHRNGRSAAWGRLNRRVYLAMCREGRITLRG